MGQKVLIIKHEIQPEPIIFLLECMVPATTLARSSSKSTTLVVWPELATKLTALQSEWYHRDMRARFLWKSCFRRSSPMMRMLKFEKLMGTPLASYRRFLTASDTHRKNSRTDAYV